LNLKNLFHLLFFPSNHENKKILAVLSIVIAALILDASIGKISGVIGRGWAPSTQIVLFILIAVAYGTGQYFLLGFVKRKANQIINKVSFISKMNIVTTLIQYILIAIPVFVILQIVFTSSYYTLAVVLPITISCSLAIAMMFMLAQRFFRWYKSNRDHLILLYGLSSAILAVHLAFTLVFVDTVLLNTGLLLNIGAEIRPHSGYSASIFDPSSVFGMLNSIYFISAILSFILLWGTTVLLLRHHYSQKRRLHKFRFWSIVSLPLAFFLVQYVISYLELFVPLFSVDPILFAVIITLIFTVSLPIGGILFGLAFLSVVRNLPSSRSSAIRDYITISAFGFILFFVSDQISIIHASYPPFGLATISFVGLSSYLILMGVYSSAMSLSQDAQLRRSLRKSAINQLKLLHTMGEAQMEHEIVKRVVRIAKKQSDNMIEETGVQPSLSENDMKKYLEEVLQEIKVRKA
jgi:hypothetical protein